MIYSFRSKFRFVELQPTLELNTKYWSVSWLDVINLKCFLTFWGLWASRLTSGPPRSCFYPPPHLLNFNHIQALNLWARWPARTRARYKMANMAKILPRNNTSVKVLRIYCDGQGIYENFSSLKTNLYIYIMQFVHI